MDDIKRVYAGIPDDLINSILWVADKYRVNPLSLIEGGSEVIVVYWSTEVFGYDKIKKPSKYIEKIHGRRYSYNSEIYDREQHLEEIKSSIRTVYARKYTEETYEEEPFEMVWDSSTAERFPWEELEAFDNDSKKEFISPDNEIPTLEYEIPPSDNEIPPPSELPWYVDKI